MIVHKCDRCKKEITVLDGAKILLQEETVKTKGHLFWKRVADSVNDMNFELCKECSNKFMEWMKECEQLQ